MLVNDSNSRNEKHRKANTKDENIKIPYDKEKSIDK